MGFFSKLFEKKECSICGGEIGLLGNRKLEDGNCCKTCANKLSVWFDDRRHSTVEQIKAQLNARGENQQRLQTWHHDLEFGEYCKMYVQLQNGVPQSFVVTSSPDYREANADILPFSWVASCTPDIRESRNELKRTNAEGERVSYDPPRYEYRYDFYIKLDIQGCPYIDDISFRINRSTLELETVMPKSTFLGMNSGFDPMHYPEYRQYKAALDEICEIVSCGQRGVAREVPPAVTTPVASCADTPAAAPIAAPVAASVGKWTCNACGAENTAKFCQNCGTPKPEPAAAARWKCFCGTVNTGKFCGECGTLRFTIDDIVCSECSWTAEPGDEFTGICPSCDHKFGPEDLDR